MDVILTIIFAIFFLILFPLGELARIGLPNNIALTGLDIGVGMLIIIFLSVAIFSGAKFCTPTSGVIRALGIFLFVSFVSLLMNIFLLSPNEFFVAFLYLLRFTGYTSVYFLIKKIPLGIKQKIPVMMLLSGVLLLLIGYIQYFLYPSLRNLFYLGWDVHLYRMFGSFLDPNFFGAFLVLYLLFLLGNGSLFARLFPIRVFLFVATVVALVLTYSRSAYIMCVVGVVAFFLVKKPSKHILYGAGLVMLLGFISYFLFTKYSEGTNLFRITSTLARVATSQHALIIFSRNPVFGVGFDAYRYAQQRYGFIQPNVQYVTQDHAGAGTDNSFLFVLATTGFIGFVAYLYLLWNMLRLGQRKSKTSAFAPVLIASILALCADAFFINSLFYPFILIWVWILIAETESSEKNS